MEYGAGFYKMFDKDLIYGPNFVWHRDYELNATSKDTYAYPVDGWYWFDTLEQACTVFGLDPSQYKESNELQSMEYRPRPPSLFGT